MIPNILVNGIPQAIERSAALKVYFVNLMWQPGETIDFAASRHVEAIHAHAQRKLIDCVVLNTAPIPAALKRRYARAQVKPVENDFEKLAGLEVEVVTAGLIGDAASVHRKVRHDPVAIAKVVIDLASRSRARQVQKAARSAQQRRKIK